MKRALYEKNLLLYQFMCAFLFLSHVISIVQAQYLTWPGSFVSNHGKWLPVTRLTWGNIQAYNVYKFYLCS